APDREGAGGYFPHVFEDLRRVAEVVGFQGVGWLVISDDLDTLDRAAIVDEIDALGKEETAFHPLEGYLSVYVRAGYGPRTDQAVQALEGGVRRRRLLWSLRVAIV